MPLVKRERGRELEPGERFFESWPSLFRRPFVYWTDAAEDLVRVDEYRENGTLVIRAEMAGIDPEKDVEITVAAGMLHIEAERRQEEKEEGKDYYRRELRYGSFSRDLALPEGTVESDIEASYKDGILEIRVPVGKVESEPAKKIPVAKT